MTAHREVPMAIDRDGLALCGKIGHGIGDQVD